MSNTTIDYTTDVRNAPSTVSSIFSPNKSPGVLGGEEHKQVSVANGASYTILSTVTGSGYITGILLSTTAVAKLINIKITVDGEATPSINMSWGDLMGSYYLGAASASTYACRWITANNNSGPGGEFKIPIPFASSVSVVITNNSGGSVTLWSNVTYRTGVTNNFTYTQHLYAHNVNVSGITINTETDMLNVTTAKPGVLAGIAWTYDGFPGNVTPRTGPIEGPFKIYIDSSATPSYTSNGSESLFAMSDYFASYTPQISCGGDVVMAVKTSNTYAAMRFFTDDPIMFNTGLRVSWTAGNSAIVSWTGTATLFGTVYYYVQN